ncbi:MAG: L,D-transpeptidase [Verrucomicrobia bacterium]|nr:L,D-transpeptidase [Verrucomicrobiota bacterium]
MQTSAHLFPDITATPRQLVSALPDPSRHLWIVDLPRQRMQIFSLGECTEIQPVSTSRFGLGNTPDSGQTPLGWHEVTEVIGRGGPLGQPFVSRKPVGSPFEIWTKGEGDAILTRVLPLRGLVPTMNGNSLKRHIYIHGTHQEERLGQPASHGCIRMANEALARLADTAADHPPFVWVGSVSGSRSI